MPAEKILKVEQHQVRLETQGHAITPGRFEILCITEGTGNGWDFPAEVLRRSLPLWEGVYCFLDHQFHQRSVRDLAGVIGDPHWVKPGSSSQLLAGKC